MERSIFDEEHDMFRQAFRSFLEREVVPNFETWEKEGITPREMVLAAGAAGFLCMAAPAEYGGGGVDDFRYNLITNEEVQRARVTGAGTVINLHNDVCAPYILKGTTEEQKARWLPGMCSGELLTAICMTEPVAGSDLAGMKTTAIRDGDVYVVNGSKTFITNGINADLAITAVKTDPQERHKGMSMLVIEEGMEGFTRGRNLDKIGMHSQDTAELFFDDVKVPVENLIGEEGTGFIQLVDKLPQERLSIAASAIAAARTALTYTLEYCKEREAFGKPIGTFQNTRFQLAEMQTEITIGERFVDDCVIALNEGVLTAEEAAMAKWWTTELQKRTVDTCLQLHGGYGYMLEYPIAQAYVDARIQTIYGGTTEIMKEIIGRSMGV